LLRAQAIGQFRRYDVGSTNEARVLEYFWADSLGGTTNDEIQRETGVAFHQQVDPLVGQWFWPLTFLPADI
jgi:hypothetical protein